MFPRHKHDRRSHYRLVVHFNHLKPPTCNYPAVHWDCSTTKTFHWSCTTIRASWRKRSHELTIKWNPPLSWKLMSHQSSLNQHPTLRKRRANKPSLPNWRTLEVDQFGVPDCGKEYNPQTTTSLSLAPKAGSNVDIFRGPAELIC